jgi:hypothetical protein
MAGLSTDAVNEVNSQLSRLAGYDQALNGQDFGYGFPTGPDGRVLPGFRIENARAYARAHGYVVPSGQLKSDGTFTDPNADHWYSDPRVIGPIAVGAASLGAGLLGGPSALLPEATGPSTLPGAGASIGSAPSALGSGVTAGAVTGAATGATTSAAPSLTSQLIKTAIGSGIPLAASLLSRGADNGANAETEKALLAEALKRTARTDPLHQAVTQLAYSRLPISARAGTTLTGR